ncbi:MAG: LppA family lipoprotein, partial [Mycobacterium sp.]
MRQTPRSLAAVLAGVAVLLTGCIKPNTFNPYANPGRHELDRLQKIVNDRPDLETVQHQLAELDTTIRATIAKYSPPTQFSMLHAGDPAGDCMDPFDRTIGAQQKSALFFGRPVPSPEQW